MKVGTGRADLIRGDGFAHIFDAAAPYAAMTVFWLIAAILTAAIALAPSCVADDLPTLKDLFGGIAFVRANPAILGAISPDLFAVLLGGATALLPIYARDILPALIWKALQCGGLRRVARRNSLPTLSCSASTRSPAAPVRAKTQRQREIERCVGGDRAHVDARTRRAWMARRVARGSGPRRYRAPVDQFRRIEVGEARPSLGDKSANLQFVTETCSPESLR
jgi:hypothetical protein